MAYTVIKNEKVEKLLDKLASENRDVFLAVEKRIASLAIERYLASPGLRPIDENCNFAVKADGKNIHYCIDDTTITILDID